MKALHHTALPPEPASGPLQATARAAGDRRPRPGASGETWRAPGWSRPPSECRSDASAEARVLPTLPTRELPPALARCAACPLDARLPPQGGTEHAPSVLGPGRHLVRRQLRVPPAPCLLREPVPQPRVRRPGGLGWYGPRSTPNARQSPARGLRTWPTAAAHRPRGLRPARSVPGGRRAARPAPRTRGVTGPGRGRRSEPTSRRVVLKAPREDPGTRRRSLCR